MTFQSTAEMLRIFAREVVTRRSDMASAYMLEGASALDDKDAEIARLRDALRPFAEAFRKADDPGVSDLYDEQPFSLHVSLGAWRRASRELKR